MKMVEAWCENCKAYRPWIFCDKYESGSYWYCTKCNVKRSNLEESKGAVRMSKDKRHDLEVVFDNMYPNEAPHHVVVMNDKTYNKYLDREW